MSPLVSVVIPAYNAAGFIGRSIASLRQQTLTDMEILVVDDASTDATVATVKALMGTDPGIRLLEQARNGGVAAARNTGIDQARGCYIAFLDADDVFLPQRLAVLVQQAQAHQLDVVGDNQVMHDVHLGRDVGIVHFNPTDHLQLLTALAFLEGSHNVPTWREILSGSRAPYFPIIKPIIRRDFLTRHALRYDPAYSIGEDFDLHIRCLLEGAEFGLVPRALYVYTLPYSVVSSTRSPHTRTRFDMQPVLDNVDQLLARYADTLDPEVRQALVRCKDGSRGLEQFEAFKRALYRTGPQAMLSLVTTPMLWQYVARSTTTKLRNLSTRRFS